MIPDCSRRNSVRPVLLGALLIAFVLRVINLDGRPIWYDEAFAVLFSAKSFAAMWYGTVTSVQGGAADVHPILDYSLLHLWMDAAGQSAFAVRFMSVTCRRRDSGGYLSPITRTLQR